MEKPRPARIALLLLCAFGAHAAEKGPPDLFHDWSETGFANIGWGNAIATAGDVNGDGYSDILIGAPYYSFGQSQEGLVYLYYGSANGLLASAGWSYQSNLAGAQLGWSVAPAGDTNGDGYDDFLVGAPGVSNGHANEGRVYVFKGSASGPLLLNSFELNEADARFGHCVAWAGDVNGDGYDDILAGAPEWGGYGTLFYIPVQGAAALYYGSASGPVEAGAWKPKGGQEDSDYGYSVSGLGDINGDGYADVMVGQPMYDPGIIDTNNGRALLYLGSASGLSTTASWDVVGGDADRRLGTVVAYTGDCNGDDLADAVVAVPGFYAANGAFRYFRGHAAGGMIAGSINFGNTDEYARSLAGIGDYDGDGLCDLISGGGLNANVDVWGGHSPYPLLGGWIDGSGSFGAAVASAGDVNGDGFSDWLLSEPAYGGGVGRVYAYHGAPNFSPSRAPDDGLNGDTAGALMGWSVAGAGDVGGDGDDDLLVGLPGGGAVGGGEVRFYSGTADPLSALPFWSYETSDPDGRLGESVSTAGDVNGDGHADFLVGEPGANRVHVFYGGSALSSTPDWTYTHPESGADFGAAVDCAGDVNADGYADIVVGAPLYDGGIEDRGLIRIFYGSPWGLDAENGVSFVNSETGMRLGAAVAGVGDGNGDGFDDVAAGAPGYDLGVPDRGGLFVYYGGAQGMSGLAFGTSGIDPGDALGTSVAAAGDVDGDGHADLIVGMPGRDVGSAVDVGQARLMLGVASGVPYLNAYDVFAPTQNGGEQFGISVAGAGDLAGQGFTDFVVASKDDATGQGRIDYHGLRSGSIAALRYKLTGAPANGIRVAALGDFDGDGLPENVVGGPGAQLAGQGAFWIFAAHMIEADHVELRYPSLHQLDDTPIALRGSTAGADDLKFVMNGWTPNGNARLRLEWQIAPEYQDFGSIHRTVWVRSDYYPGLGYLPFAAPIDENLLYGQRYHWRMRVASSVPFHPKGRWVTQSPNSATLFGLTVVDPVVAVEDDENPVVDGMLRLAAPYPNPFNPSTTIRFQLPLAGEAELRIVDLKGRLVRSLHRGELPAGQHEFAWHGLDDDGRAVASGSYFAVLEVDGRREAQKLTLVK